MHRRTQGDRLPSKRLSLERDILQRQNMFDVYTMNTRPSDTAKRQLKNSLLRFESEISQRGTRIGPVPRQHSLRLRDDFLLNAQPSASREQLDG